MAVSKLVCPECEEVLRPAKALPAGKKVKCPTCGTTFAVPGDEIKPAPAARRGGGKPNKETPAPKKTEEPKPPGGLEYETSTYAVIKEPEDEELEEKEERGDEMVAELLKVKKTKDPRGLAQDLITKPSNYMIMTGALGALSYIILLLFFIVIKLMPPPTTEELDEGAKRHRLKGLQLGQGVAAVSALEDPNKTEADEKAKKSEGVDLAAYKATIDTLSAIVFIIVVFLYLVGIVHCALVIYGAVKSQNLIERGWGIASSILAMVPLTAFGFMGITVPLAGLLFTFLYDDPFFILVLIIALVVIELAWGVSMGIWNLKTLADPAVIAGFEFDEDTQSELET